MKYDRCLSTGVFSLLLLTVTTPITDAVPLFSFDSKFDDALAIPTTESADNFNEVCVVGDVVYAVGDSVPPPEPCQRCVCAGINGVACTSIQCPLRPGCRAVQRSDQCCPDYSCECTVGERVYDNGERIPEAGSPCQVCYCRGGSVECAVLECFWRDDCEPRYEPGRCCPKFDHCPPPADSQQTSRPMNSSTPMMAELKASTIGLPIVTFQKVVPTTTVVSSPILQETTTLPPVEQEEITTTISDHQAASTPTQDGGAITESAVEAPSEPSSAPENLKLHITETGEIQEGTTENSTEFSTEQEARSIEVATTTEKSDETTSSDEHKEEEIPAESVTYTATDIPEELKINEAESTTRVQEDSTSESSVTDIPETTVNPIHETETAAPESRSDDFTELSSTDAPKTEKSEIEDISTETPEVVSEDTETTTFEVPTTTETAYEAVASNQKLVESNTDKPDEPETTTDVVNTESSLENRENGSILDEIQSDKISENLETSTHIEVTEKTLEIEGSTESPVDELRLGNDEILTETYEVGTTTENLSDLIATETSKDESSTEARKLNEDTTEEKVVEEHTTEAKTVQEMVFEENTEEIVKAEENVTGLNQDENTTEMKTLEEITTEENELKDQEHEYPTENKIAAESVTENVYLTTTPEIDIESRIEPEVTTNVAEITTEVETLTQENKGTEAATEINSSLIASLQKELAPAIPVENETISNQDIIKNMSNNMAPAEENESSKKSEDNKSTTLDELAKTLEKANFPYNLANNSENDTTTESNEFLLNDDGFVNSDFGESIEISPFPRPLSAPATAFNDWRLAAVQDHSEDGLQSWRDEIDLSVDPGAADILLLPWSGQHLRRRRASPVAQYVQNHGRRHN